MIISLAIDLMTCLLYEPCSNVATTLVQREDSMVFSALSQERMKDKDESTVVTSLKRSLDTRTIQETCPPTDDNDHATMS